MKNAKHTDPWKVAAEGVVKNVKRDHAFEELLEACIHAKGAFGGGYTNEYKEVLAKLEKAITTANEYREGK